MREDTNHICVDPCTWQRCTLPFGTLSLHPCSHKLHACSQRSEVTHRHNSLLANEFKKKLTKKNKNENPLAPLRHRHTHMRATTHTRTDHRNERRKSCRRGTVLGRVSTSCLGECRSWWGGEVRTGSGFGDCILHNTRDRASSEGAVCRDDSRRFADALQVEDEFVV
jgi:hypothetical protein